MIIEDFEAIRQRCGELSRTGLPKFVGTKGAPGDHCAYCPMIAHQLCPILCSKEYENRYGINPFGTPEERKAAGMLEEGEGQ